ncbi:hypothetical protein Bca52824_080507 [Brassica carinata]|uniref:Uncharacterized protein n=1 Tax=Brassica carinata TaxID=52824 RepID=A0A8X7TSA7_BRACI|nr:hypothetical protein Bca52824_080507 [Brassica carinata]
MVTMLLRFAKLGRFRGELQISNAFDASQMIINPSIPEAEAFKELMNDDDKTLTSFQSNEDSQEDNDKQDSIYLSESQETADAVSTPSSKRKEDETIDQGDLSSTSKKPCTRSIKIEMVEEANKKR